MTVSHGRAWKFDRDVSSDELISARHVFEFDELLLRKHLLEEVRPEITRDAQSGDLLVCAGAFAHGSNHSHPFIAMKALGLGLLTRSLMSVDFGAGMITNEASGARYQSQGLSPFLQEIVDAGGGLEHGRRLLAARGG